MKATISFDLDDYNDRLAHKRVITAQEAYSALYRIHDHLYQQRELHGDDNPVYDELITEFTIILADLSIDLGILE